MVHCVYISFNSSQREKYINAANTLIWCQVINLQQKYVTSNATIIGWQH